MLCPVMTSASAIASSSGRSIQARRSGLPKIPFGPQTRTPTLSEPTHDQATHVIFCGTHSGSAKPAATVSTSKSRIRSGLSLSRGSVDGGLDRGGPEIAGSRSTDSFTSDIGSVEELAGSGLGDGCGDMGLSLLIESPLVFGQQDRDFRARGMFGVAPDMVRNP